MNSVNFLDLARQGKNQWWRYLIGILSILTVWVLGSTIVVAIAFFYWTASTGLSADAAINGAQKFDAWLQTSGHDSLHLSQFTVRFSTTDHLCVDQMVSPTTHRNVD